MNETTVETIPDQQAKEAEAHKKIEELRFKIDVLDGDIIRDLAKHLIKRSGYVDEIGQIKRDFKFAVHDPAREARQFARYADWARFHNTEPEQMIAIFRLIILWSRYRQKNGFKLVEDLKRRRPPGKIP